LAIAEIGHVKNIKDIQWLIGCLAALSRFMSPMGERGLPLYKLLKKTGSFRWTDKMLKALDKIKALISKPLGLASPEHIETLLYTLWQPPKSSAQH
jgi:hypothetical protein